MMLIHGEGGPASPAEACALLRQAALRVELARLELDRCGAGDRSPSSHAMMPVS